MKMKFVWLIVIMVTMTGCLSVGARKDATSMSQINRQQVLVVGKIELIPGLQKNEQRLNKKAAKFFKDKAFVVYGDKKIDMRDLSVDANRASSIITLGKTFFLPIDHDKNGNIYFSGLLIVTDNDFFPPGNIGGAVWISTAARADHILLPVGIKFKTKKSMDAVYIGTMQIYRDDFNGISKIRIKDEYRKAAAVVRKKFKGKKLHKINATNWK